MPIAFIPVTLLGILCKKVIGAVTERLCPGDPPARFLRARRWEAGAGRSGAEGGRTPGSARRGEIEEGRVCLAQYFAAVERGCLGTLNGRGSHI